MAGRAEESGVFTYPAPASAYNPWWEDLIDFGYHVGADVGPYELARIKAENEAIQRKALERRGATPAEIGTAISENEAEIDRYLHGISAHPDDPFRVLDVPLNLKSLSDVSKIGGSLVGLAALAVAGYFIFQFVKTVRGK